MYKVFIENRPIIFTEKITKKKELESQRYSVHVNQLNSIEQDLHPLIQSMDDKNPLYVICNDLENDIERLFEKYDKITAAGGIVRRKNHFLFIKRNGYWDLPKGKIENKESIEEAAVREIEEECGIVQPLIEEEICVTYHTYEFNGIPTLKKTYWFSLSYDGGKELNPQAEEGITKAKWLKASELDKVKKKTFASIIEVMNTFFGHFEP